MAIYTNTFEGGTNGATITTGNSGGASGTAFSQVTAGITYTTDAMHGSRAATSASSATEYTRWSYTDSAILLRSYHKFASLSGQTPLRIAFGTGSIVIGMMTGGNLGRFQLYSGGGLATSPGAISPGTWYRFELYVKTGSGNGEVRAAIYTGDSTSAWWDSGLIAGLTIDSIANQCIGKYDTNSSNATWDSVGIKTGADAVWGAWPYTVPVVGPTIVVSRPADNLADLRSSTSGDASTLTYATPVRVSGPTLTTTSLTSGLWLFSQDSAVSAVYTLRVTQVDNQTASQDVTIPALTPAPAETISAPLRLLSAPPSTNWG